MGVAVVLFDLGNVVFDVDFKRVFAQWSAASGVPAETLAAGFSADREAGPAFELGAWSPERFHRHCAGRLGLGLDQDAFEAGWNNIFGPPTPGIEHLLAALRPRARLAVFSNTNAVHERAWMRIYAPTLAPFERIFTSHGLGRRKPEPAAFAAVAEALGVAPGEVLFLDDAAANVAGARTAGMKAAQWGGLADGVRAAAELGLLTPAEVAELTVIEGGRGR
jgi:putative hydrolase of the HAD superfamily